MSYKEKQPRSRSAKENAEAKKLSYISIHCRIISICWILMKSFGYTIEIGRERRKAVISFPYYLVLNIVNEEKQNVFNLDDLLFKLKKEEESKSQSKENQMKKEHELHSNEDQEKDESSKKQGTTCFTTTYRTKYIKKKINNMLIDEMQRVGFDLVRKRTKTVENKKYDDDNDPLYRISYICYDGKKFDFKMVEELIGNEARDFFTRNDNIRSFVLFKNNYGNIVGKYKQDGIIEEYITDINPDYTLWSINSIVTHDNQQYICSSQQTSGGNDQKRSEMYEEQLFREENDNYYQVECNREEIGMNQNVNENVMVQYENSQQPFFDFVNGVEYFMVPVSQQFFCGLYNGGQYFMFPMYNNQNILDRIDLKEEDINYQQQPLFPETQDSMNVGFIQQNILNSMYSTTNYLDESF